VKAQLPVISTRLVSGRTLVNVVSDGVPGEGFAPVEATLEDVYFAAISDRLDVSVAETQAA
jgi:ABC-2 type transport system ATP-binding protein